MILRHDRGELARATSSRTLEGRAARTHAPGDALEYPSGPEFRDDAELASIAAQLATGRVPVTLGHPSTMPATRAPDARIVGYVASARVDGAHVVTSIEITDPRALELIDAGVRELSLGYSLTHLDARRFQRGSSVDHLALVERARCGASCSIVFKKDTSNMCCTDKTEPRQDAETLARDRAKARLAAASKRPTFDGVSLETIAGRA